MVCLCRYLHSHDLLTSPTVGSQRQIYTWPSNMMYYIVCMMHVFTSLNTPNITLMPSVQHPTARRPCTLYMLVLSYSVHPTVWGHDHSAQWVFCVCKVTLQARWWHPITAVSCVYILAIWGHQVIHCEGQLQAWVRSECWCRIVCPLLGPAAAAAGVCWWWQHSVTALPPQS